MTKHVPIQAVLGAKDPEMIAIREVLQSLGIAVMQGSYKGDRCSRSTAYHLDGVSSIDGTKAFIASDTPILLVECGGPVIESLRDLNYKIARVDHHYPGDPGYDCSPKDFWKGSSLGQICEAFNVEPTPEQVMIAASDHCPIQAYRGECPGVDPAELSALRLRICATSEKTSIHEVEARLAQTMGVIEARLASGEDVPHFDRPTPMLPEASLRLGVPVTFAMRDKVRDCVKVGLMTASPDQVTEWMENTAKSLGLIQVYGCPKRGYAGGYYP